MSSSWSAKGLSQDELMIKDECILVNEKDVIVGHANKKESHIFSPSTPRGKLHRAFSVFLFDSEGKLLLQQRSLSKITFPGVWTNTCCSHPLYGSNPTEVDLNDNGIVTSTKGVVSAAIRKLEHELGIDASQVPAHKFKFLTRLHYWAVDAVTHGENAPWGEHEMDYILFIQANVKVVSNDEEVAAVKYVSYDELYSMMKQKDLLWSPWFKIIASNFLNHWWKDLRSTLTTDKFVDVKSIYRFDPSSEHMGGAGQAGPWLGAANSPYGPSTTGNSALKQGAYGKVKIHSHSKLEQILRVDEVFAALWFKFGGGMENKVKIIDENYKFCDDMLGKVSRSFASVIRQLPTGLCLDILIFYLALRALDTIEDDMEAFKGKEHIKIDHLNNFYLTGLVTDGWSMDGVGLGDEKVLLQQYYRVVAVFKSLPASSQEVIADITKRMGQGMASYVKIDLGQGTITVKDYNLYCHYVAGLVGEGLSRLFSARGYESPEVAHVSTTLANTMGLFLQKTNIIRDYLEDYVDGRAFWPQEIWKQYSVTGELGEFALAGNDKQAVSLLNHLVTDALECVPECMDYMAMLQTEEVFRFCAIPQVMAIATLAELYNNHNVFTGVVKIRKGFAAKLILDTKSVGGLHKWFNVLARDILRRIPSDDPNADATKLVCQKIVKLTDFEAQRALAGSYAQVVATVSPVVMAWSGYHLFGTSSLINGKFNLVPRRLVTPFDYMSVGLFVGSVLFFLGYQISSTTSKGLRKSQN